MMDMGLWMTFWTVTILALDIHCGTTNLYFSDQRQCGETYTVDRADRVQIHAKRANESDNPASADCSFLFRAGDFDDTLCLKIATLRFSSNRLQYQYYAILDPTGEEPNRSFDYSNPANTPVEICDGQYEISIKLHVLDGSPSLDDVTLLTEVYNKQDSDDSGDTDSPLTPTSASLSTPKTTLTSGTENAVGHSTTNTMVTIVAVAVAVAVSVCMMSIV